MVLETSGGGGQHQAHRIAAGRPLLASPAPCGGRWAAHRPGTPCATAAATQRRAHHAGPCAAALSGGAAVCCCVTPHTGPARLQLLRATGRGPPPAGGGGGSRPALWAVPPAPSGLRAAPLPTLGGVPPPAPSIPLRGLAGVMWRPRPGPCGPRPGQVGRQPLHGGTPPQCKAKPLRGRLQRALHCSSPVPVAAQVLRGGPAPTVWGLWGRPPLRPRPSGGRSGPGPLAGGAAPQPSRGPGCGLLLQPLPLRGGRNLNAAR